MNHYRDYACMGVNYVPAPSIYYDSGQGDSLPVKVTGESSIEIFATNNEVVYISSRVHVSNKLSRTKYSY